MMMRACTCVGIVASVITGSALGVILCACAPTAEGGTGTEGETETEGSSGTGGASATVGSATLGTSTTTTATTSPTTTTTTTGADTTADATATEGPLEVGEETAACPPGSDGCPCDIGSTCDEPLLCVRGTCVGEQQCEQPEGERNDIEADAVSLDAADCGAEAQVIAGALGDVELDWFAFDLTGGFPFCATDPVATAMAAVDLEVCIYAACDMGNPSASCGFGNDQMEAMSPDGLPGCCGNGTATLTDSGCNFDGLADSVFVSVSGGSKGECLPYNLAWSF